MLPEKTRKIRFWKGNKTENEFQSWPRVRDSNDKKVTISDKNDKKWQKVTKSDKKWQKWQKIDFDQNDRSDKMWQKVTKVTKNDKIDKNDKTRDKNWKKVHVNQ